ncbi:bifunctional adenosylcobinamide kinase/adenosylcobinamide-phosphate guanylyltransferase [Fulvivirgaceae bacterium BMA12]|uniref:Adenosylcobinamide kinase n=1 Tax=Agaribacillus aureus TaxID=3051825 RepID=A0ABT8L592_9BACT|nr:bifunctional adenosylcobinamide kinase/adenosylcobinamide-phosphate guanylyltransferase [Fulvivirgaceae bacterium BMA12]
MIYFITGGARSGKSSYAMKLAKDLAENPVYVATARHWDGDFQDRIRRHQAERDEHWTSIEEQKEVSSLQLESRVAVIDCVTLWLTNFFVDFEQDVDKSFEAVKQEIDKLKTKNTTFIIISNEIGMGVHAETATGRKFTDLQGWANQYLAKNADKAIFMVSGLPMILKE